MAIEKVGIYRKYHGPVPTDNSGKSLPKEEWPKKRAHRWCVRWFGSDDKRYSKSFKSRKEAEWFAESKQAEVREGKADRLPQITLSEYRKEHRGLMKGCLAKTTLEMQMTAFRLLACYVGWDRPLAKISIRDIEKFRVERLGKGISPSSANRELRTLKRLFNLAIVRGYLKQGSNPCTSVPMIKIASKTPVYCSPQEYQKIYQAASDGFWKAFLITLYTTGIRLREATNLTWKDVDFDSNRLYITRKQGQDWVQPWQPKDHEIRMIPLPEQAINLLTAWQSVCPEQCPYIFMDQERWDFYRGQVSTGQWQPGRDLINNLLRRFKTICRKAGVGPYTVHDLRRSCITNWAKHLPIHVVQQLAGHSDIKTTQTYYLSVQPDDIKKARKVQASLLGKIPESDLTDPKLTHSAKKRVFPGKKVEMQKPEELENT